VLRVQDVRSVPPRRDVPIRGMPPRARRPEPRPEQSGPRAGAEIRIPESEGDQSLGQGSAGEPWSVYYYVKRNPLKSS
jgi:hypothetical protein